MRFIFRLVMSTSIAAGTLWGAEGHCTQDFASPAAPLTEPVRLPADLTAGLTLLCTTPSSALLRDLSVCPGSPRQCIHRIRPCHHGECGVSVPRNTPGDDGAPALDPRQP